MIKRCFADVSGRAVHYRRAGQGPPVVMFHGSPGDSQMLLAEIADCAAGLTVFAFDTAGFGYSDPLPGDVLSVKDLAAAAAAAMQALGLPQCPVYGTHTGAAIAIELAVNWPQLVSGVVLEGLPAFTQAEIEDLFTGYFAPMVPDPLGGHLVSTWMRFRDQFTWFPWLSRDVRRLNALDRPDPASVDLWVSMFYRSCKTYRPAYRAACHYGQAALRAAGALRVPAIYMATAEDMLFPHLDRLPALQPNQRIERLPSDPMPRIAAITRFLSEFSLDIAAPAYRQMSVGAAVRWRYVDGPHGQIFLRCFGDANAPAMILLHDAPGTSLTLQDLAIKLATKYHVIVPDHPGAGLSDAPDDGDILEIAAGNLGAVAQAFVIKNFSVGAIGCGAAVAACLAKADNHGATRFVIADMPVPDATQVAPAIALSATGAHWVEAWLMLRDYQIYRPWYDGTIAAQRQTQGNFDAGWLQDQTAAFMEGRATCHLLPRAAAACSARQLLAESGLPFVVVPEDEFMAGDETCFELETMNAVIA